MAPQEGIHAYLLFRGCDIKDLHVHEQEPEAAAATEPENQSVAAPATETAKSSQTTVKTEKVEQEKKKDLPPPPAVPTTSATTTAKKENDKKTPAPSSGNSQRRSNPRRNTAAVGTGASLLNRKARGAVQGGTYPYRGSIDLIVHCSSRYLAHSIAKAHISALSIFPISLPLRHTIW